MAGYKLSNTAKEDLIRTHQYGSLDLLKLISTLMISLIVSRLLLKDLIHLNQLILLK